MTRRRARRGRALSLFAAAWALIIVAALARDVLHVIGWLALTAILTGSAYAVGRRRGQAGKLASNAAYGKRSGHRGGSLPRGAVEDMDAVSPYPAEMMRRARANGWIPPGRSTLVSGECAAGECIWCHDLRCQHDCDHVSRDRAPVTRAQPERPQF